MVEHLNERRFQLLVDSVTDYAICMLDPQGIVASWNPGAERLTQYKANEIIGKHFSVFYPEELRTTHPARELETATKEGRYEEEGWRVRKDGSKFWANVVLTPIFDAEHKLQGFAAIIRDLTTKRAATELLRQSEERLNLMISSVRDYAIFMLDPTGVIQTWNTGAARLSGYTAAEIIGKHFSIFCPESERASKPPLELEIAAREGRYEEEGWRVRKDGTRFWASVVITALIDPHTGKLAGFCKVTRDLTEKRRTQELLRQSEERLQLMIQSVKDYAIFMLSPQGIIETWNPGAQRIKGYTSSEIIGKHFSVFYTPEERDTKPAQVLETARKTGRFEEEGWRVRKDGSKFWASVVITAVHDPAGMLRGFVKITRDLTERRKADDARLKLEAERLARVSAERANRMKDEFLAVISHELRTPLTPIVGWSKMLQDHYVSAEDKSHGLQIIERNAQAQMRLIEDLLDISAIISGKLTLKLQPVGLSQTIEAAIEAVRTASRAKNISVTFVMEDSVGPIVGDPVRLQQIFWNLLNNAVKFTPPNGSVTVRLRRKGERAELIVADTGEGIPAEYLPHVFDRFSQLDTGTSRKYGGLGIGLYVVKQLVTLHGGEVRAESAGVGKGATFYVELPRTVERSGEQPYPLHAIEGLTNTSLLGRMVLVVDDEQDAREFLAFALRTCGATTIMAASAHEALEVLKHNKIDLLLTDIGMPAGDGYSLLKEARKLGITIPAVAVTAYARAEDAAQAQKAGFAHHVAKPVNPSQLCALIADLTNPK